MAEIEVKNSKFNDAFAEIFKKLLDNNIVEAVLVPQEVNENVIQTLVCESKNLEKVNPLAPVLPVNSARFISKLTIKDMPGESPGGGKKIAVLLRPCEIRALIELVKLKQAKIDDLLIVGIDCFGTYSVNDFVFKSKESPKQTATDDFIKKIQANKKIDEIRYACQVCENFTPLNADIAINLIGTNWNKKIILSAGTEKGKKVFEELKLTDTPEDKKIQKEVEQEKDKRRKLKEKTEKEALNFFQTISSLCINCQNCRSVCPICYCKQCVFEGQIFESNKEKYIYGAKRKGLLKMPTDMILFHMTRLSHVLTSCVGCGLCEEACPNNIPLGRIYTRLSTEVQKIFEYVSGRSIEDELPLSAFKEDELQSFES